jgi:predicted transcriptional regulator
MKVLEFINGYKNAKVQNTQIKPNAVSEYIKEKLEVKDYLPFAEKRELCASVLNACNTKDNSGLVKVDSVSRYITFTITIISKYTNIEFSSGDEEFDLLDEYDMLCQNNLLNPILDVIGAEYATCNNILNMMMDDIVSNNNTVEAVIGSALNRVTDSIDRVVSSLADKVDELNLDFSQIDIDKYKGLLDLLPQK